MGQTKKKAKLSQTEKILCETGTGGEKKSWSIKTSVSEVWTMVCNGVGRREK